MLKELLKRNRSYRRFFPEIEVTEEVLKELVSLTRLCPSAGNLQPLRFILSSTPEKNNRIFPYLRWAGYLKDWPGPSEEQRPAGYIIILGDTTISRDFGYDCGIVAQTILLGAVEKGLGGCIIGAIDKKGLRNELDIQERYEILLVIAIGKPAETVVLEDTKNGDIRYWRDEKGIHYVPKRKLEELIIEG